MELFECSYNSYEAQTFAIACLIEHVERNVFPCSSLSENELLDDLAHRTFPAGRCRYVIALCLHGLRGVGDADPEPCSLDHGQIVEVVSDGDRVRHVDAEHCREAAQTVSLGDAFLIKLYVAVR